MNDYRKELEAKPPLVPGSPGAEILYPLNSTLIRRNRAAAAWAWVLIGFSAVNVLFSFIQAPIRLVFGSTATEMIFQVGHSIGPVSTYCALVLVLGILAAVAYCGANVLRSRAWAFWAIIAFIGVDTLLFVSVSGLSRFIGVLFRVGAIVSLYSTIRFAKIYADRKQNGQA